MERYRNRKIGLLMAVLLLVGMAMAVVPVSAVAVPLAADIIFVVDESGSMA